MDNFTKQLTHILIDRVNNHLKTNNEHNRVVGFGSQFGLDPGSENWVGHVWIRYSTWSESTRHPNIWQWTESAGVNFLGDQYSPKLGPWTQLSDRLFSARFFKGLTLDEWDNLRPNVHRGLCEISSKQYPELIDVYQTDCMIQKLTEKSHSMHEADFEFPNFTLDDPRYENTGPELQTYLWEDTEYQNLDAETVEMLRTHWGPIHRKMFSSYKKNKQCPWERFRKND